MTTPKARARRSNAAPAENPNRARIVEVARRLFYTRGYGATSLGDLAAQTGIPKGNFYYHFRSKDDVLRAVLAARKADVDRRLTEWSQTLPTPSARLHRVIDMLVHEEQDLTRYGCPMGSLLTELGKGQDQLQREAFCVLDAIIDYAARSFVDAGQANKAAHEHAVRLIGRCQGAVVMAHGLASRPVLQRETNEIRGWLDQQLSTPAPPSPQARVRRRSRS